MNYKVGQVLYVLVKKQQTVIPVQVVEQILRRTLSGEETMYTVNVPTNGGLKEMPLSDISGEVFEDLEQARTRLLENATAAIGSLIDAASKTSSRHFQPTSQGELQPTQLPMGQEVVEASLEDGTVVKVHLPEL